VVFLSTRNWMHRIPETVNPSGCCYYDFDWIKCFVNLKRLSMARTCVYPLVQRPWPPEKSPFDNFRWGNTCAQPACRVESNCRACGASLSICLPDQLVKFSLQPMPLRFHHFPLPLSAFPTLSPFSWKSHKWREAMRRVLFRFLGKSETAKAKGLPLTRSAHLKKYIWYN